MEIHHFAWLGGHNAVQLIILGEVVHKGQDHITKEQQTLTGRGIADMACLLAGNVQPLAEDGPVSGCLVQQIDKVAVFKDILDLRRGQKVVG